MTEQGTDIEMNSTWTTEVKMNSLKMTPASSSTTFKNGLPYYGKIKVLNGDDSPAPGIDVEVCAQPEYAEQPLQELVKPDRRAKQQRPSGAGKYCGVRQSDSFGIVSFELLSNEAGISSYDIKVSRHPSGRFLFCDYYPIFFECNLNLPERNFWKCINVACSQSS